MSSLGHHDEHSSPEGVSSDHHRLTGTAMIRTAGGRQGAGHGLAGGGHRDGVGWWNVRWGVWVAPCEEDVRNGILGQTRWQDVKQAHDSWITGQRADTHSKDATQRILQLAYSVG